MPKILDVIHTRDAIPEHGLPAGAVGTVLEVFDKPTRAYEVEFANEDGETIAMVTLTPAQVREG